MTSVQRGCIWAPSHESLFFLIRRRKAWKPWLRVGVRRVEMCPPRDSGALSPASTNTNLCGSWAFASVTEMYVRGRPHWLRVGLSPKMSGDIWIDTEGDAV